jgi:prepilin-type N-terminal cleavage/methylation domain-containing protein
MKAEGKIKNNKGNLISLFTIHPSSLILRHSQKGFTFLEVMIALAIVGIAVIAIFNTVNYHADVAYEHTVTTQMFLLAKEKLIEMKINPENKKGNIPETGFSYETTVVSINDSDLEEKQTIIEVKAVIRGQDKEVELSQLVLNNQD